jgi:hypothetical protein
MPSLCLFIISVELLSGIGCGLLNGVRLSLAGLNLPLNATVLADANALGIKSLHVNAHAAIRFPSQDRVRNGNSNISVLASHAA